MPVTEPSSRISREAELRANALRAANGRRFGQRRHTLGWLWDWAKVFPAAVILFFVMRTFLVEAYKIPSASMDRTLLVGDFLLVNKLLYGAQVPFTNRRLPAIRAPRHGDVLVFVFPPDPSKNFVKRIIGLPGDTILMQDGVVQRNGATVAEPYVVHTEPGYDPMNAAFRWQRGHLVKTAVAAATPSDSTQLAPQVTDPSLTYRPSRNNWGPLVVPSRQYFVLGDNRDNSLDSRYWGFVSDTLVRGTPIFVYYSFRPDSTATMPWFTQIRWGRLGTVVR